MKSRKKSGKPDAVASPDATTVLAQTRMWLERAVIGLNLCPFAQPEFANDRIRYQITSVRTPGALLGDLAAEMLLLQAADPRVHETTLLIHPQVLQDFLEYNQFLEDADVLLRRLKLEGILQIASFHPQYRFAGTRSNDITNYTNRSPYPMLHLLREASVARAMAGRSDATSIVERNLSTMRRLGAAGWKRLGVSPEPASGCPAARPKAAKKPRRKPDGE